MAVIKPFRGVRYNPARFEHLDVVVSQPYDRITEDLERRYHSLNPYNITGIILGHDRTTGSPAGPDTGADTYTCAQAHYHNWLAEGVLMREDRSALYAYEQRFTVAGRDYVRMGLIAALELAEFDEGTILPHERTHDGPKADRLSLLRTLEVNTEQVFMLYPDPENRVNGLLRDAIAGREPDIDVVEMFEDQVRQRVWVITDPALISVIQAAMAPMRGLIIADGHHRYETALNYRHEQHAGHPGIPADAALNYTGVTLVSMDDPGLVVLPTHREICNFTAHSPAHILERAKAHFTISDSPDLDSCLSAVNAHPTGHAFGFYGGPVTGFHVLTLKDDVPIDDLIPDDRSPDWKRLAVSIAHRVLLEQIAEVPVAGIEDKSMIRYHRDAREAVASVDSGAGNFVIFLSPTAMSRIKACAAHGEKMPQKSTDFYPKVISGLTMLPVGPAEYLQDPDTTPVSIPAL